MATAAEAAVPYWAAALPSITASHAPVSGSTATDEAIVAGDAQRAAERAWCHAADGREPSSAVTQKWALAEGDPVSATRTACWRIDSLRHHDYARLNFADAACAVRLSRCDWADLPGEPRRSRGIPVDVCAARRRELASGFPEVDRCAGGTMPQCGRRQAGRPLAVGLQVLSATAFPVGPQRTPIALGRYLA